MGPPRPELGLELQDRSPSPCQGTPQTRFCQKAKPPARPYRHIFFCGQRAGAGQLVVAAGQRVGSMLLVPGGVGEVCVVIQATAMDLRGRERGWGRASCRSPSWLRHHLDPAAPWWGSPSSAQLWEGCSRAFSGPGFCPTLQHAQLSPQQRDF